MADLQTAMVARIAANTELDTALGDRVHWNIVPQNTQPPYLRLQTISDPRERNLATVKGPRRPRVQADVFAKTYAEARSLSEALITMMQTPGVAGGVRFGGAAVTGPRDLGEDTTEGFLHRLSSDMQVEHSVIS